MTITDNTTIDSERVRTLEGLVEHLSAELGRLTTELADFRADLTKEVRTERLAIVHPDDGRELIRTERGDGFIQLYVDWLVNDQPQACYVVLQSGEEMEGEAYVYIAAREGQAVGMGANYRQDKDGTHTVDGLVEVETVKWHPNHPNYRKPIHRGLLDADGLRVQAGDLSLRPTLVIDQG